MSGPFLLHLKCRWHKQVSQFLDESDLIRAYESPERERERDWSVRGGKQKMEAQTEGGMNRGDGEKKNEGERNGERRAVDSSCSTLGWRLPCLCVCECALQMSNGLWRACLSCLVLHPFHHYMPSISPSLNLPVSSLCSPSLFLSPSFPPPFPPPPVSSLTQTGLFYIVCKVLWVFNSSSPLLLLPPLSVLKHCSVSHLSPSLISLREPRSRTRAHTLNHSLT